ncbi:uncharacterized protein LOC111904364 [Lactuca sativa]|uniref:uncharacterized protein LOC111904364 n=1 Tax=Lactuca sativa TaxID=4236 RepID=UPI000CD9A004|nr:uncharacterized protein LOC111904364 [Lactuca sativa]
MHPHVTSSMFFSQGEEATSSSKTAQCTVSCMYQAHIGGFWRTVTAHWTKNIMHHSLNILVDSVESPDRRHHCKVDLKPWHFWGKKSYKTFEVDSLQIDVYWDFRSARFSSSPEPSSNFYVALICDEEVVLLIGDLEKKVYKRTKSRPGVDTILFFKKEHVFGKKSFTTKARFDKERKDYEILVESSTSSGSKDPEMWISIDGVVLIHIRNLQWKFRGNETVLVNKQPIEVLWDVHAWLFLNPGSNHGSFIFKPGQPNSESDKEDDSQDGTEEGDNNSVNKDYSNSPQCCVFLYAWKIE